VTPISLRQLPPQAGEASAKQLRVGRWRSSLLFLPPPCGEWRRSFLLFLPPLRGEWRRSFVLFLPPLRGEWRRSFLLSLPPPCGGRWRSRMGVAPSLIDAANWLGASSTS